MGFTFDFTEHLLLVILQGIVSDYTEKKTE